MTTRHWGRHRLHDGQGKAGKPFFVWMNTTRMHVFTHVRQSMSGQSGIPGNEYADGMIEMDGDVGRLLKAIDDLGIAKDTIVVYSTDNGPNQFSWPNTTTTPFRSKRTRTGKARSGCRRFVRWPDHIKPGEVPTEMFSGLDWFPTLLAALPAIQDVKERLLKGYDAGWKRFHVSESASRWVQSASDYLTGQQPLGASEPSSPIIDDDGVGRLSGNENWKACFEEMQEARWLRQSGIRHSRTYRIPKLFNLRMDPIERADIVSEQYDEWRVKNAYLMGEVTFHAAAFLETFKEYPPSQRPAELAALTRSARTSTR